jgi:hypothetical protein
MSNAPTECKVLHPNLEAPLSVLPSIAMMGLADAVRMSLIQLKSD